MRRAIRNLVCAGSLGPALLAGLGCGRNPVDPSESKNVFGNDDRENITSQQYPWTTIGRLDIGCSGAMIGHRLALTAAHCVFDSKTQRVRPGIERFELEVVRGAAKAQAGIDYVWYGGNQPEDSRGSDWAVLHLTSDLGDQSKWLPVEAVDIAHHLPYRTNLAGYSQDRDGGSTGSVHRDCSVHSADGDRLLHDCDGAAGVSGGPLLAVLANGPAIVGLSVSEYRRGAPDTVHRDSYSDDYANVGISAQHFERAVATLVQTADQAGAFPHVPGVFDSAYPGGPAGDRSDPHRLPDPQAPGPGPAQPPTQQPEPPTSIGSH